MHARNSSALDSPGGVNCLQLQKCREDNDCLDGAVIANSICSHHVKAGATDASFQARSASSCSFFSPASGSLRRFSDQPGKFCKNPESEVFRRADTFSDADNGRDISSTAHQGVIDDILHLLSVEDEVKRRAPEVDPSVARDMLDMLDSHLPRYDDQLVVFLNAEGKARDEGQLSALLESVERCFGHSWMLLCISEADWVNDHGDSESTFLGHSVWRHGIPDGRAMKFILNRIHGRAFRGVDWSGRAGRIDLCFVGNQSSHCMSVALCHLGHGSLWDASVLDLQLLLSRLPKQALLYLVGDMNVELRPELQTSNDKDRAATLLSMCDGLSLSPMLEIVSTLETRRPTGLSSLLHSPSCIDMGFVPSMSGSHGRFSWEDSPGDHAWGIIEIREVIPKPTCASRRGKWHCTDLDAYTAYVNSLAVPSFANVASMNLFFREAMEPWTDARSSRQRRKEWEPQRIKTLRTRLRLTCDPQAREELRKKIFHVRVQVAKTRAALLSAAELKARSSKQKKTSKIYPISAMKIDGAVSKNPHEWAEKGGIEFNHRWKQSSENDQLLFNEFEGAKDGLVSVSCDELQAALSSCGKPLRLDHDGVCIRAVSVASNTFAAVSDMSSRLLSSDSEWHDVSLTGVAKAKRRGTILPSETHGILPQTWLTQMLNKLVLNKVLPICDAWSVREGLKHLVLGVGKGAQTRDAVFSISQALEKGRDRHNACAVVLADIRKCHDELSWGAGLLALRDRGVDMNVARAFFRLHRLPKVSLQFGGISTGILALSRGGLTGSSSASTFARLLVEDVALCALPNLSDSFCISPSCPLPYVTWSDNLCVTGDSIPHAISNFNVFRHALRFRANLEVKPDSIVVLPSCTKCFAPYSVEHEGEAWRVVDREKVLGSWVSGVGLCSDDAREVRSRLERCFWSNCKVLCNSYAAVASRIKFWRKIVFASVDHLLPGLRPSRALGDSLEKGQNKILTRIIKLHRNQSDTVEAFVINRNRAVARARDEGGVSLRERWGVRLVSWVEHVFRHPESLAFQLLHVQDDEWLQTMRILVGRSGGGFNMFGGETQTRTAGIAPQRWGEGWVDLVRREKGWENPARSRALTKARARLVIDNFILSVSQHRLALELPQPFI